MTVSLFLRPDTWDICLDTSGNIAVVTDPSATIPAQSSYRIAQDVACAVRVFRGDLWWNTTAGIPYLGNILGQQPAVTYVANQVQAQALSVPGVVSATLVVANVNDRNLTGQIQVTDSNGGTQAVAV